MIRSFTADADTPRRRLVHRRRVGLGPEPPERLSGSRRYDRRVRSFALDHGPAELVDGVQVTLQGQVGVEPPEPVRFLFGPALGGPLLRRPQGDRCLRCVIGPSAASSLWSSSRGHRTSALRASRSRPATPGLARSAKKRTPRRPA